MPKSLQRWVTKRSISTKLPGSRKRSTRSRAVSLPAAWCLSIRSCPPATRASWVRFSSSWSFSFKDIEWLISSEEAAKVNRRNPSGVRGLQGHLVVQNMVDFAHVDAAVFVRIEKRMIVFIKTRRLVEPYDRLPMRRRQIAVRRVLEQGFPHDRREFRTHGREVMMLHVMA